MLSLLSEVKAISFIPIQPAKFDATQNSLMKKGLLFLLLLQLGITSKIFAQCGTIMVNASSTQYPDTATNLPSATVGTTYSSVIQFYVPSSISGYPVVNITFTGITGLPTGFTFSKYPSSGIVNAGSVACITIASSNVPANTGVFPFTLQITVNLLGIGSVPGQINGYRVTVVPGSGSSVPNEGWYSQADWIREFSSPARYVYFLMKDTMSYYLNSSAVASRGFNNIAAGSTIDARDPVIDYTSSPILKAGAQDSVVLDSIYFPYLYVRNTDSVTVSGNIKRAVKDTLLVSWYTSQHLKTGVTGSFNKYSVPSGQWDSVQLVQNFVFKRDTILLSRNDSTMVQNLSGGFENSWNLKFMQLKAPAGMVILQGDTNKIFGFSVSFRSGVPAGADSGLMICQVNPSLLPPGIKRPNYFGYTFVTESYQDEWSGLTSNSFSNGMEAIPQTSYRRTYGWLGFVAGSAFTNKRVFESGFYMRSFKTNNVPQATYSVSDSVVCKGKTVTFSISNCELYKGAANLGSGSINQTILKTTIYDVRKSGNLIGSITVRVNDSLVLQSILAADTFLVCGLTRNFALGVTTSYPGSVVYQWLRNDTLLAGKMLAKDSFAIAGRYRLLATTASGCVSSRDYLVQKANDKFNLGFTADRTMANTPPYNFNFTNNSTPFTAYNYQWTWGDGNTSASNLSVVGYTYPTAGLFSVKLKATDKTSGCADSLIRPSYITVISSTPLTSQSTKVNPKCLGGADGSITVTASGGVPPYQYRFMGKNYSSSNTFNNLSHGIYLITVKDAIGDTLRRYDTLSEGAATNAGPINGPVAVNTGALSTYIVSQQLGHTYQWQITGGLLASGQGTNIAQVSWPSSAGSGRVKVIVANADGCIDSASVDVAIGSTGMSESWANGIQVFPNPAHAQLTVNIPGHVNSETQISLREISGKEVLVYKVSQSGIQQLPLNDLASGTYLLSVTSNAQTIWFRVQVQ